LDYFQGISNGILRTGAAVTRKPCGKGWGGGAATIKREKLPLIGKIGESKREEIKKISAGGCEHQRHERKKVERGGYHGMANFRRTIGETRGTSMRNEGEILKVGGGGGGGGGVGDGKVPARIKIDRHLRNPSNVAWGSKEKVQRRKLAKGVGAEKKSTSIKG